jgi:hypothetical protein
MKRVLWLVSLAVLLFSCKITKHVTTETQTSVVAQQDIFEQTKDQEATQTNENKSDNSIIETDENEVVKITVFSLPDSLGQQHITSVTEIHRNKTATHKKDIKKSQQIIENKEKETIIENKTQTIANIQTTSTEKSKTETKTPGWVYVIAIGSVIAAFILIYFILKKHKIL